MPTVRLFQDPLLLSTTSRRFRKGDLEGSAQETQCVDLNENDLFREK